MEDHDFDTFDNKRDAEDYQLDARMLKRKKTVTWADDELELPLASLPLGALGSDEAHAVHDDLMMTALHGGETPAGGGTAGGGGPGGGGHGRAAGPAGAAAAAALALPCDGLFDALGEELLQEQEDMPGAAPEQPLSRRQLLERRLAWVDQLSAVYEGELWALLEELRLRHQQFTQLPGRSVWKAGGSEAAAGGGGGAGAADSGAATAASGRAAAGSGGAAAASRRAGADRGGEQDGSEPEEQQQRQQQQQDGAAQQNAAPALAAAQAATAPGAGLRVLWDEQLHPKQPAKPDGGDRHKVRRQQPLRGQKAAEAEKQKAAEAAEAAAREREQHLALPPPPPRFEDVESLILSGKAVASLPPVDAAALVQHRRQFVRRLSRVGRLEQGALGALCRQLDALGGLGLLVGRRRRYVLRRAAVVIGRCTESQGKVDVDLSEEAAEGGSAQRLSRQQAQLWLEPGGGGSGGGGGGGFRLRCTGRRAMLVNGRLLSRGQTTALPSLSHIEAGDVSLLFVANTAAVARAVARSAAATA